VDLGRIHFAHQRKRADKTSNWERRKTNVKTHRTRCPFVSAKYTSFVAEPLEDFSAAAWRLMPFFARASSNEFNFGALKEWA